MLDTGTRIATWFKRVPWHGVGSSRQVVYTWLKAQIQHWRPHPTGSFRAAICFGE